jgi:hypothetical protein
MRQLFWMSALSLALTCSAFWNAPSALAQATATKGAPAKAAPPKGAPVVVVVEEEDEYVAAEFLLPPGTTFLFAFPDVPGLVESVKSSTFGKLLADPDFQPFINDLKAKISEGGDKIKEELGLTIEDLLSVPQGQVAFAIIPTDGGEIAGVLYVDYGDSEETITKLLDKAATALKENGSEITTEKVGEVEVTLITLPEEKTADSPVKQLAYFMDEGSFVFGTSKGAIEAVLARWDGDSEDVFAKDESLTAIFEKVGRKDDTLEPDFKWFINPVGLTEQIANAVQEQQPQAQSVIGMLPVLGLDKLRGVGGSVIIDEDDFDSVVKTYVLVDQPTSGVINFFKFPAIALAPPKWVGANAAMYTVINWDFQAAYTAAETLYDSFVGPGTTARQLDALAQQEPNIHIKKDVIDLLGGKIHFTSTGTGVSETNPVGDLTVAIEVKDTAAASKLVGKILDLGLLPSETRDFEGQKIYEFDSPQEGISPALAVVANSIVITADVGAIEGIVRGTRTPLSTSPTYAKLAKFFPPKVSSITFQKGDAQIKTMYEQLRAGEGLAAEAEGIDFTKLPPFEKLAKYLRSSAGYSTNDDTGSLTVQFTLKEADPK